MNWLREQAEHYHRMRTDPDYRRMEQLADIAEWNRPAEWIIPAPEPAPAVDPVIPDSQHLQRQIDKLRAENLHLTAKLNQHLDKSKTGTSKGEAF